MRYMSTTSPEVRAQILSAVKDDGVPVPEAAKTHGVSEDAVYKWLKVKADNAHTSSSELSRLRRENTTLREIIGNLMLERELAKKNFPRP